MVDAVFSAGIFLSYTALDTPSYPSSVSSCVSISRIAAKGMDGRLSVRYSWRSFDAAPNQPRFTGLVEGRKSRLRRSAT